MKVAVIAHKGGVAKTTTAVHLAAYFQELAPTVLFDADESATEWQRRGPGFPFRVAPDTEARTLLPQFTHVVIDPAQAPSMDDLRAVYPLCDVIVIPSPPRPLDIQKLARTIASLRQIGPDKFAVLLTQVARDAAKEATELRRLLDQFKAPVMRTEIPYLKAYVKATAKGEIVSQTDDKNAARAWDAYAQAGKELQAWRWT